MPYLGGIDCNTITSEQFHLQKTLFALQSPIAFFCHNFSTYLESTLVLLLGIPFNIISYFSDNITGAYPPNTPQHLRYIHQRGQLFSKFLTHTIQPVQTFLPVSSLSIISADNNSNWENAPAINPATNIATNRPNSFTCLQLKFYCCHKLHSACISTTSGPIFTN